MSAVVSLGFYSSQNPAVRERMALAMLALMTQKGIDPREFALVAFGGAGPLHGVEVAAMLGFREVI